MLTERRNAAGSDRRRFPRGGRRQWDEPGKHPRLILADIYEGVLRPCQKYLDHFAFDVSTYTDGQEVLAELDARPPAVLLMGTKLKNPPAREILAEASELRKIPVILIADAIDDPEASEAEPSHGVSVLVKPFALHSMVETIRSLLRDPNRPTQEADTTGIDIPPVSWRRP
jgi:two-component system catabolic regulation response regulator CreB